MSCHRFDLVCCRKPNRFSVMGSIVYTVIHLSVYDGFPDNLFYSAYSNCLTTTDAAFCIPARNYSKDTPNSQTGRPVYPGQPAFPALFHEIVPIPHALRQRSLLRIVGYPVRLDPAPSQVFRYRFQGIRYGYGIHFRYAAGKPLTVPKCVRKPAQRAACIKVRNTDILAA